MSKQRIRRTHFPDKILLVPPQIREQREQICKNCYFYKEATGMCSINDKFVVTMFNAKTSSCPMGQWSSYYGS